MAATMDFENWDDDKDFEGELKFGNSLGTHSATNLSSRRSVSARSESNAADEDWQVLLTPNDDTSTTTAINSAKTVGIPLPHNIPQSALLGGTIKRLGKPAKASTPKLHPADDWGADFDIPAAGGGGGGGGSGDGSGELMLKLRTGLGQEGPITPNAPANFNHNVNMGSGSFLDDDFDTEWAEGSLGIRFGGTRRDARARSSSVSAMSPSMGSTTSITLESEDDELGGLVLPDEPIDFKSKLELRKQKQPEFESKLDLNPLPTVPTKRIRPGADDDDEDMLSGLELEGIDFVEHAKKRTFNRNVKVESAKVKTTPSRTSITTLTFTDKSTTNSRIPRPSNSSSKPSPLAPVYESTNQPPRTANQPVLQRVSRVAPTTTSAQLLRSKRSAPVLGRTPAGLSARPSVPFLPAGVAHGQSPNVNAKSLHVRQPSDSHERPTSPPARSFSRMSVTEQQRATPSRAGNRREGYAAPQLARVAASNQRLHVQKKRVYGQGNELDAFDDLPTSAAKESKFVKEPILRGPPKTLRRKESRTNLQMHIPERSSTATPASSTVPSTPGAPATPKSYFHPRPTDNTPRFARDTAASRNAREQRLSAIPTASQPTLRREVPSIPSHINWKAQVAARSPHSPTSMRKKNVGLSKKPNFISPTEGKHLSAQITSKGMVYNAAKQEWEGNDHMVYNFPDNPSTATLPLVPTYTANHSHHHHTSSIPTGLALGIREVNTLPRHGSPPRPALISNVNHQQKGPRIERGMVFDPHQMKWLKVDSRTLNPSHPASIGASVEDDDDPFAGIDDLADEKSAKVAPGAGGAAKGKENTSAGGTGLDDWNLGEEFDLGQRFIKRQKTEEAEWRKWVESWFPNGEKRGTDEDESWKWEIRRVAERYAFEGR